MWWGRRLLSAMGLFILLSSARWKLTRSPFYVAEWPELCSRCAAR